MARRRQIEGEVKYFMSGKGFGCIDGDDGWEYFVHFSEVNRPGFKYLRPGERVTFYKRPPSGGDRSRNWQATNVNVIDGVESTVAPGTQAPPSGGEASVEAEANLSIAPTAHDPSQGEVAAPEVAIEAGRLPAAAAERPFQLRPVMEPRQFVGRDQKVMEIAKLVGDFRSVIVHGDIGIGKSSLLNQIEHVALQDQAAKDRFKDSVASVSNRLAFASYNCIATSTIDSIRTELISQLKRKYSEQRWRGWGRRVALSIWQGIKYRLGGVLTVQNEERRFTLTEAQFNEELEEFLYIERKVASNLAHGIKEAVGPIFDGVVLVIDDLEKLTHSKVPVGEFARACIEGMAKAGYDNVCFILCGAGDIQAKVWEHNNNVRHVFQTVQIPGLSPAEMDALLNRHLEIAGKRITSDARDVFIRVAAGNPRRLFYLGSNCARNDVDGEIGLDDCKLTAKEFIDELAHAGLGTVSDMGLLHKVLELVADIEPKEVSPAFIVEMLSVGAERQEEVQRLCTHLVRRDLFRSRERSNAEEGTGRVYQYKDSILALWFRLAIELGLTTTEQPAPAD